MFSRPCFLGYSLRKTTDLDGWQLVVVGTLIMLSVSINDNVSIVSSDASAVSLGIIVMAMCLLVSRGTSPAMVILLALLVFITIQVRPAYLFLVGICSVLNAGASEGTAKRTCSAVK